MRLVEALDPIARSADAALVVTTMGSVREWPSDRDGPNVFHFIPSSMGQGPSVGLGLALARPERRVIVVNGDGCMLMNLGSLVTIGALRPTNLVVVVIDNGVYEVTGGQPHGGAGVVDFPGLARASGIREVVDFSQAADWDGAAAGVLARPGPVFVRLGVEPRFGESSPKPRRPMRAQIERLRENLGIGG